MKRKTALFSSVLVLALALRVTPTIAAPPGPTIVDVAIAINEATKSEEDPDGEFATLIAAVQAADPVVIKTLNGNGQFTVFAPTDAAFAALNLDPENVGDTSILSTEDLTQILLYHVARGRRDASQLQSADQVRTLQRGFLGVDFVSDTIVLTDNLGRQADVVIEDVPAANGLIQAINAVVLPYLPGN
jgi:uncharacterized surface protein with fasciclin (FAS1) repeats